MPLFQAAFGIAIAIMLSVPDPARANGLSADPTIVGVMEAYRSCVQAAASKAAAMKSAKVREKVFSGQMKGCDRSRIAGLEIAAADDEQAALRSEIAAITEGLIDAARSDLGL